MFGRSSEPHARSSVYTPRRNAVVRHHADDRFFEPADVFPQADSEPFEVENRVADQLSRSVERDVAAAVYVKELCSQLLQGCAAHQQVFCVAAFAQRVDRGVFDQQHRACLICRRAAFFRPAAVPPSVFLREEFLEQRPLQFPAGGVVHRSEVAAADFHASEPFALRSASSAMYDDRTSGALAQ